MTHRVPKFKSVSDFYLGFGRRFLGTFIANICEQEFIGRGLIQILSVLMLGLPSSLSAVEQNAMERSQEVADLRAERKVFYRQLAEAYAPIFYADQVNGRQDAINPGDAILSPYFDGDQDWSNNPIHILELASKTHTGAAPTYPLKAQVLFSVIETKTFFYIAYTKYNALDTGPGAHGQDSEVVWSVVQKNDQDPLGKLSFVVTSAHGFPKIYAPDESFERQLRQAQYNLMKFGQKVWSFTPYLADRFAFSHEVWGRPEFENSSAGLPRRLHVFVAKETHALYKCNTKKWSRGDGRGTVYFPVALGQEGETRIDPLEDSTSRSVGYSLLSLDEIFSELYPQTALNLSTQAEAILHERRVALFEGHQNAIAVEVSEGTAELRSDLPTAIAHASFDRRGEARLANDWTMKTSFKLALPHLIHRALEPENEEISDDYIFNSFIEYRKLVPIAQAKLSQPHILLATDHALKLKSSARKLQNF